MYVYERFTHCQQLMGQWIVMAAPHCYSWWRRWWRSNTLWEILKGYDSTHCDVIFKLLLWRFLCNFKIYCIMDLPCLVFRNLNHISDIQSMCHTRDLHPWTSKKNPSREEGIFEHDHVVDIFLGIKCFQNFQLYLLVWVSYFVVYSTRDRCSLQLNIHFLKAMCMCMVNTSPGMVQHQGDEQARWFLKPIQTPNKCKLFVNFKEVRSVLQIESIPQRGKQTWKKKRKREQKQNGSSHMHSVTFKCNSYGIDHLPWTPSAPRNGCWLSSHLNHQIEFL